jgi:hypothetical protein
MFSRTLIQTASALHEKDGKRLYMIRFFSTVYLERAILHR